VGKAKAEVAAARVMERVAGVHVTPHFCRIEEKPADWYREFHVIALGLDSLEARYSCGGHAWRAARRSRGAAAGAELHQRCRVRLPGCVRAQQRVAPRAQRLTAHARCPPRQSLRRTAAPTCRR
jgi:hypothetical protein